MTHLLDKSALLADYLAEPGVERVQTLFEDDAVLAGEGFNRRWPPLIGMDAFVKAKMEKLLGASRAL